MPGQNPQEDSNAMERQGSAALDLDQVLSDIGLGYFHNRLLVISGLGFSAVACEILVTAFTLPELRSAWNNTEYELGLLVSCTGTANILGQLVWGVFADGYGRRLCFMLTVLVVAVFGILTAFSQDLWGFICFRACCAFGMGGNISVDFAMFSEFLSTQDRGHMLWKMQVFWPLGQLLACLAARFVIPDYGWRAFLVVVVVPSIVTAFFRPLIPESPRWLLLNGRVAEAVEVCRHMATLNGINPEDIGLHADASLSFGSNAETPLTLNQQATAPKRGLPLVASLFSGPYSYTTLGICIFSAALHALSYGNLTYMPSLLEFKGIARMDRLSFMIPITLCEFPGVLLFLFLSKHVGRLVPMKVTFVLIGACFLAFAAAQGTAAIVTIVCCSTFLLEGCWGLFHVYVPEAYPTELRATAVGWTSSLGSLAGCGLPFAAAYVLQNFGVQSVCVLFASFAALGTLGATLFLHVETTQRALEDRDLNKTKSAS